MVLRNLHLSINTDEIKEAPQNEDFSIRNVSNIQNAKTKEPRPIFFVDLEPVGQYKKIYEIEVLLQHRITVESPRPRKTVLQCMTCQRFWHTRTARFLLFELNAENSMIIGLAPRHLKLHQPAGCVEAATQLTIEVVWSI